MSQLCNGFPNLGFIYPWFFWNFTSNFMTNFILFFPVIARPRKLSTPAALRPNTTLPLNWVLPPRTKLSAVNDMPHVPIPVTKWWRLSDKLTFKSYSPTSPYIPHLRAFLPHLPPHIHTKNPLPHLIKLFIYSTFVEPCCFSDKTGEKAWGTTF